MGISNTVEKAIRIFHPLEAPENALDKVVLEWLDLKITRMEERIMEFERKYGMEFSEFDKALKEKRRSQQRRRMTGSTGEITKNFLRNSKSTRERSYLS